MALKQTEDQVKQMRDDVSLHAQTRSASVRSKIASKVSGKPPKERLQSFGLSDQDIKAALGLVDESWERQEYRLQQYLQRNYNIANGVPTTMEVDDEEFERPDTAASLSKIVEKVKLESTPTAEKDLQLGVVAEEGYHIPKEKEIDVSFSSNKRTWESPRLSGQ